MKNVLPNYVIEIPLEDTDLKYFGALPSGKKVKKYVVKVKPTFDFLILEINGTVKKIDFGDSERLEQELYRGNTVEMDLIIGSENHIKVKIEWTGKHLAGGSKATTMEIAEEMKVEVKKAMPVKKHTADIQLMISKVESNLLPFIAIQDVEIFKGSVSIKKARTWYG